MSDDDDPLRKDRNASRLLTFDFLYLRLGYIYLTGTAIMTMKLFANNLSLTNKYLSNRKRCPYIHMNFYHILILRQVNIKYLVCHLSISNGNSYVLFFCRYFLLIIPTLITN